MFYQIQEIQWQKSEETKNKGFWKVSKPKVGVAIRKKRKGRLFIVQPSPRSEKQLSLLSWRKTAALGTPHSLHCPRLGHCSLGRAAAHSLTRFSSDINELSSPNTEPTGMSTAEENAWNVYLHSTYAYESVCFYLTASQLHSAFYISNGNLFYHKKMKILPIPK